MRIHLVLFAATLLASCGSPLSIPPGDFDAARAAWNGMGVANYHFDFQRNCFCVPDAVTPVTLYVEGGSVVRVVSRTTGDPMSLAEPSYWPSMTRILDEIEEARASGSLVTLDIGDQGLPTLVEIGNLAADAGFVYQIGPVVTDR